MKPMNNHDLSENDQETPVIPTIQDRRRQLEAFQAERARNKSLGASVRGPIHSNQLGVSQFGRSYRPRRSIVPSEASLSARQGPASTDDLKDHTTHFPQLNTKRIIQHFDALSRKTDRTVDKPFLGIRRYGTTPHRIEKSTLGRNPVTSTVNPLIVRPQALEPEEVTQQDVDSQVESERNRLSPSQSYIHQTKQASIPSIRELRSMEPRPKNVHQERHAAPGKTQEEIYFAQAQLLQSYMKQKRFDKTFLDQERAMQAELDAIRRVASAKQTELLELKEKFKMEQDLAFLEDNLGVQKDKLIEVMEGLKGYKKSFEDFTLAFEREGRVPDVSGLEAGNLDRWLNQTRKIQRAADAIMKSLGDDRVLVQGVVRTLSGLNNIVRQELEELKACFDLTTKISQTEAAIISLSSM